MSLLIEKYEEACRTKSDINEHLPTLKKYADDCNHITEFGTRTGVSTWAWLMSSAKTIRCFDNDMKVIKHLPYHYECAEKLNKDFTFTCVNTIAKGLEIEPTDLLFVDTLHTYDQVITELKMHSNKVKKYILFHDTNAVPSHKKSIIFEKEINKAINEFLNTNKDWSLKERFTNNHGLTILKRI
jgi:cephalosporin hydroxylase